MIENFTFSDVFASGDGVIVLSFVTHASLRNCRFQTPFISPNRRILAHQQSLECRRASDIIRRVGGGWQIGGKLNRIYGRFLARYSGKGASKPEVSEFMAMATRESCLAEIGDTAGKVWHLLLDHRQTGKGNRCSARRCHASLRVAGARRKTGNRRRRPDADLIAEVVCPILNWAA